MRKRPATTLASAPDFRLRKENVLLRSRVEKLSREMQEVRVLHASMVELDTLRAEVRDLRERLGMREIEVVGLSAELERAKGEQGYTTGAEMNAGTTEDRATGAGGATQDKGREGIWASRRAADSYFGCECPELGPETPTSIDERVRALRQHLAELGPKAHVRRRMPLWRRVLWTLA